MGSGDHGPGGVGGNFAMARMSLDEFERYVISAGSDSPAFKNVAVIRSGLMWSIIRAYLVNETFVDIFYNQVTGQTSFAQIHDNCRVFGADNKGGWHWHPLEDPLRHLVSDHEITFDEFLKAIEKNLK